MNVLLLGVRAALFYAGYGLSTALWGVAGLLVGPFLPFRPRFRFIVVAWTVFMLWWLRVTCGVHHRISGLENVPATPCVVLCKHQSTWETYLLQSLFVPTASVLKRELLNIPFFGWTYRMLRPIAIDRSKPTSALKTLIREGSARLHAGIWVTLLPEGTRVQRGQQARFHRGGIALARAAGVPVLLVAHNAGWFWPPHRFLKYPGTVDVLISPPIATTGRSADEVVAEAQDWMSQAMAKIEPPQCIYPKYVLTD